MGKFKRRVAVNRTSYAQRNEAMDAMRILKLRRLNPMLLALAVNLNESYDTQDASCVEDATDAFTAVFLAWVELNYYIIPDRVPPQICEKVTIASFSEFRTLFRFRDGNQVLRIYQCLKEGLEDEHEQKSWKI